MLTCEGNPPEINWQDQFTENVSACKKEIKNLNGQRERIWLRYQQGNLGRFILKQRYNMFLGTVD